MNSHKTPRVMRKKPCRMSCPALLSLTLASVLAPASPSLANEAVLQSAPLTMSKAAPSPSPETAPKLKKAHRGKRTTSAKTTSAPPGIKFDENRNPTQQGLVQGYRFFMAGQIEAAEKEFRSIVETHPWADTALTALAQIAALRREPVQARYLLRQAIEINPHNRTAKVLSLALSPEHDPQLQQDKFLRLLRLNPHDEGDETPSQEHALIHFQTGLTQGHQARWHQAAEAFRHVLHYFPNHPDVTFNLAVSLDQLGRQSEAVALYRQAILQAGQTPHLTTFAIGDARARLAELESPTSGHPS